MNLRASPDLVPSFLIALSSGASTDDEEEEEEQEKNKNKHIQNKRSLTRKNICKMPGCTVCT
jgi:hypothetical protein